MGWRDGCAFDLPQDAYLIQEATRAFATEELVPLAATIDREHNVPRELVDKLAALGLLGALIPVEQGGSALSTVAYALMIEELAAACASTAIVVSAHNSLCAWPIKNFGSEYQKNLFLPQLAAGNLGCFALSEPGTGSDAAAQTTVAEVINNSTVEAGRPWKVTGVKNWITNGPVAKTCVLFATNDRTSGNHGVVAFVHQLDSSGISLGAAEEKLGIRGSATCSIFYDNVIFGNELLLGAPGKGFKIAMETLDGGRIGVAAQAIGIARSALESALRYAKERKTFGKRIADHQSIGNYLADMITWIDAARYLTLGAALLKDQGKTYSRQAAEAKLFSSKIANKVAYFALQIHGGYGYVTDYPVERNFRDARITEIYEGTSEIQQLVIAQRLLREDP
jgi:butyryl-CoA dehydrogenase